jgi:heptosyltransferase-1
MQPDNNVTISEHTLKILIVRVSSLGDIVHNMPVIADIRQHYPDATIDWVVEEAYVDLVRLNKDVSSIIPMAWRRWRKRLYSNEIRLEIRRFLERLREQEYDYVIDTQGLLKTGVIMGMARIVAGGQKVGLANATEGSGFEASSKWFHTKSIPVEKRTHGVLRGRQVVAGALGYEINSVPDFGLREPDTGALDWLPQKPYVVFFHGTAGASKKWAHANWVQTGRLLADQGYPVLLPWGNAEEKFAADKLAADIPDAVVLPKLPMMQAVTLAQRAALVIGLDTGLTHVAAAYCRPTIELYCDSPRWKTEGNWSDAIINLGDKKSPPTEVEVQQALASMGFLKKTLP